MKLPHPGAKLVDAASSRWTSIRYRCREAASVRLAIFVRAAGLLLAWLLSACDSPVAEPGATESAAMVEKNCNDPHWREQNLGLWYSVCRPPLRW
jgi:hypothetical protein